MISCCPLGFGGLMRESFAWRSFVTVLNTGFLKDHVLLSFVIVFESYSLC
jgi:hypothetical protein